MEELIAGMRALGEVVVDLQRELEDHYEAKNLASRLKTIKSKLKHFGVDFQAICKANGLENLHAHANYLNCQKALSVLNDITAKSNVNDIIDALGAAYNAVTKNLAPLSILDEKEILALSNNQAPLSDLAAKLDVIIDL